MGSGLQNEMNTGNFMVEIIWVMETKEMFKDGCGRNYINTQLVDQNWPDTNSRVSRVHCTGKCQKPKERAMTVWWLKHIVKSTVTAGCEGMANQLQLPVRTTPSRGTCMTACMLHKSQKATSSLSLVTNKATWVRCDEEKSLHESTVAVMKISPGRHRLIIDVVFITS